MKWINWIEPWGPKNEPLYMRAPAETVIAKMQQTYPKLTTEQALDEFIVVNWATVTEDLGNADVWHEGTKSFYNAQLLRKLTPEQALFDPTEGITEKTYHGGTTDPMG